MGKNINTLGCCGLDCGLCPRFYTLGPSKCPGCCGDDFENKHPSCAFVTCCDKKRNLEACGQCGDFPCLKFDKETGETDSFITHRRVACNQNFIKEYGLEAFLEQQKTRMEILCAMLKDYDDGRSKSFYCLSCALLTVKSLNESLSKAGYKLKEQSVSPDDLKSKAKILRELLNEYAEKENEELRLRKSKTGA